MNRYDFNDVQRIEIWKRYFGEDNEGKDVFGRPVNINNFECDHIYPQSKGGETTIENGMPLSSESNSEKAEKLSGRVNGKIFKIKKEKGLVGKKGILFIDGKVQNK